LRLSADPLLKFGRGAGVAIGGKFADSKAQAAEIADGEAGSEDVVAERRFWRMSSADSQRRRDKASSSELANYIAFQPWLRIPGMVISRSRMVIMDSR
jgi:hypothetical protein